ncbi:hypothetical protein DFH28DRAFT_879917 [Melampsora americana]|nr:hypothetical protein DFH28DRAFT_879917 [Melampsora americana]
MDIEDLFCDEMNIDNEDVMPNDSSLQFSQSQTSMTGDSSQQSPATLFRPAPSRRNTPASTPSRLPAGVTASSVKKFVDLLKLTKENQDVLQKMCNITLPGEEYLGTLSYLVFTCQQVVSGGSKWIPGRVIRDHFKDAIGEFMLRPTLQAFSKTVAPDHTTMVDSLEILTFIDFPLAHSFQQNYLQGLKPEYVEDHCASDYIAGEACVPQSATYLFIKETLKNQRSKVRSVLLTDILGLQEGSDVPVPSVKPMVLQVARSCLPQTKKMGDKETIEFLGREKVRWIIFMRYVTVYNYLNHTENKKRCQWTLMDEALADLRTRPDADRALYFAQIVRFDRDAFDGVRSWATIKATGLTLPSPEVEKVLAVVRGTSGQEGGYGHGDGFRGAGAGEQGAEEGDREDE